MSSEKLDLLDKLKKIVTSEAVDKISTDFSNFLTVLDQGAIVKLSRDIATHIRDPEGTNINQMPVALRPIMAAIYDPSSLENLANNSEVEMKYVDVRVCLVEYLAKSFTEKKCRLTVDVKIFDAVSFYKDNQDKILHKILKAPLNPVEQSVPADAGAAGSKKKDNHNIDGSAEMAAASVGAIEMAGANSKEIFKSRIGGEAVSALEMLVNYNLSTEQQTIDCINYIVDWRPVDKTYNFAQIIEALYNPSVLQGLAQRHSQITYVDIRMCLMCLIYNKAKEYGIFQKDNEVLENIAWSRFPDGHTILEYHPELEPFLTQEEVDAIPDSHDYNPEGNRSAHIAQAARKDFGLVNATEASMQSLSLQRQYEKELEFVTKLSLTTAPIDAASAALAAAAAAEVPASNNIFENRAVLVNIMRNFGLPYEEIDVMTTQALGDLVKDLGLADL